MSPSQCPRRLLAASLVLTMTVVVGVLAGGTAWATGATLFDQTFRDATASGTGAVTLPATPSGASVPNIACLTATGNSTSGPLLSCPSSSGSSGNINDTPGSGVLQLTPLYASKVGGVFAATSVPTSQGLDVSFTLNQYGGGTQFSADGIAFALSAVSPTLPLAPPVIGSSGGFSGIRRARTLLACPTAISVSDSMSTATSATGRLRAPVAKRPPSRGRASARSGPDPRPG